MDRTQKIEEALAWARSARRNAIRERRERLAKPSNPFEARPGQEAAFEKAEAAIFALDTILGELEAAHVAARAEGTRRTAVRFQDLAAEFLFWFGLTCLAALGPAAACLMARAPDPLLRAASVTGIALSLALAAKTARK